MAAKVLSLFPPFMTTNLFLFSCCCHLMFSPSPHHQASIDYFQYLSKRALRYKPSAIRALQPLLRVEGMISLAGEEPFSFSLLSHLSLFFHSLFRWLAQSWPLPCFEHECGTERRCVEVLQSPQSFCLKEMLTFFLSLIAGSSVSLSGKRLQDALQYSPSYGLPDLVAWLKDYQQETHSPGALRCPLTPTQ